nr:4920_t:CDS:2 [Entrophospora candida]
MHLVHPNETPADWEERIWSHPVYFRENDLMSDDSKKCLGYEARKPVRFPDGGLYAPRIGIGICYSRDRLDKGLRIFEITTTLEWRDIGLSERLKQKPESKRSFDERFALHHYNLWEINASKRIDRAGRVAEKICTAGGMHDQTFRILIRVRKEMRQIRNAQLIFPMDPTLVITLIIDNSEPDTLANSYASNLK